MKLEMKKTPNLETQIYQLRFHIYSSILFESTDETPGTCS